MIFDALIATLGLINLLALAAVVIIGLPHGAFDGAIAADLGYTGRPLFLMRFILLYVLITLSVVILWLVFPIISLILFLLISAIHFGLGDSHAERGWFRWVQIAAHGGIVVFGISQFHKSDVDIIFVYLIGNDSSPVWVAIDIFSVTLLAAFAIYAWQAVLDPRWRYGFLELNFLLLVFVSLPPIIGFAVYFCCLHSLRHLYFLWHSMQKAINHSGFYFQAITYTIISWVLGGIAFWWCTDQMSSETALFRVVFIGLAALTVPHMLLVDGLFRRHLENR